MPPIVLACLLSIEGVAREFKMEVHKRSIKKRERGVKLSSSNKTEKTETKGAKINSTVVLVLIGVLASFIIIFAIPQGYSGPSGRKHGTTDKTLKKDPTKDMQQPAHVAEEETFVETDNTSSCDVLMDEAKQLMEDNASGNTRQDGETALDILASCILKEPENAAARWNLAAILLQLNRVEEAMVFIDEALTLDPNNKQYFLEAGKLFSSLNLHKQAVRCLEHYLELALQIPNWPHLLASISVQREDEWMFLYDRERNIIPLLEMLLQAYLKDKDSLIKTGYLFKVVIGLKRPENDLELVRSYAFFSFGLCDFANGMNSLHVLTEQQYVDEGYGNNERAFDIVSTHALRLFTAGINGFITSIARNLLKNGDNVFTELQYNCNLKEDLQQIDYTSSIKHDDIRRIFSVCVIGQNVIPVILENGAIVYTENIFGWTPLLQIVSLNSSELLFQVLKGGTDPQSRTPAGLTALHIAAIKGSTSVVLPLTQAGLKPSDSNVLNQTALDVACSHRWFAREFAKSLGVSRLPQGCPSEVKYLEPLKKGFKNGGWLTPSLKLPKDLSTDTACGIDVLGYNTRTEDILLDYIVLQKPVLIRNATNSNIAKKLFQFWQRNKIVKEYGHLMFNEMNYPLAEFSSNSNQTSLKQFLELMSKINEDQSTVSDISQIQPPPSILQTVSMDAPFLTHFHVPSVLDQSLTEMIPTKVQFRVGPAFSGISPRFHQSFWDVLIFGRRKWFLYPPKYAFYSRDHIWNWWNQQYRNKPNVDTVWECVQYPGDLLLLPDMWGHAALNLKESIGVSMEFIHGASEFSL